MRAPRARRLRLNLPILRRMPATALSPSTGKRGCYPYERGLTLRFRSHTRFAYISFS